MKQIKLLSIVVFMMTLSCTNEDENNNNSENYKVYKIKQTFSDDGSISITELNYKNDLLDFIKNIKNNEANITYLNYNSNGQIISIISDYGYEQTFTYTGNRITKETYLETGHDYINEFRYNTDGNVESKKHYENNVLKHELLYKYDNKNNMIEITELNSGYTSTSTQTFDMKKNPYLTFYPKELLVINQLNGENNVLASYQDETFVYEYNDKDYPTKQTIYESGNLESVVEFEYK